jgi:hypothetical protein
MIFAQMNLRKILPERPFPGYAIGNTVYAIRKEFNFSKTDVSYSDLYF